jgi:hypothetical protein
MRVVSCVFIPLCLMLLPHVVYYEYTFLKFMNAGLVYFNRKEPCSYPVQATVMSVEPYHTFMGWCTMKLAYECPRCDRGTDFTYYNEVYIQGNECNALIQMYEVQTRYSDTSILDGCVTRTNPEFFWTRYLLPFRTNSVDADLVQDYLDGRIFPRSCPFMLRVILGLVYCFFILIFVCLKIGIAEYLLYYV